MALRPPLRGRYDGLVLRLIRDHGPRSRTKLSEETGLSPTTISKIIAPLLQRGWLEESADYDTAAKVGRPAIALRQVPEAVAVLGIHLGLRSVRMGLADGWGRVTAEDLDIDIDTSAPPDEVIAGIADAGTRLIDAHGGSCLAAGIATPGAVDTTRRSMLLAVYLGWQDIPVADLLEERLRVPVVVDHNVRAMALAEARFGSHGTDSLAYVYVGPGLGLGVVLQGKPFWGGGRHGVIQLGHTRVPGGTEPCVCGATGCLETIVSEPAILRRLDKAGVPVMPTSDVPVLEQLERVRFRTETAAIRREVVVNLADGIANVISLLDPGLVLLGGALADAPPAFLADVRALVQQEVFPLLREDLRLEKAVIAEPGVTAGATIALERFYYGDEVEAPLAQPMITT